MQARIPKRARITRDENRAALTSNPLRCGNHSEMDEDIAEEGSPSSENKEDFASEQKRTTSTSNAGECRKVPSSAPDFLKEGEKVQSREAFEDQLLGWHEKIYRGKVLWSTHYNSTRGVKLRYICNQHNQSPACPFRLIIEPLVDQTGYAIQRVSCLCAIAEPT